MSKKVFIAKVLSFFEHALYSSQHTSSRSSLWNRL